MNHSGEQNYHSGHLNFHDKYFLNIKYILINV